ncbi:hypothetical protein BZA77DRAFT_48657 [Pyronema omphalodes]|nr:hypothetical protein BZA77DRAFT_48657 [Pyronema omphalodes]
MGYGHKRSRSSTTTEDLVQDKNTANSEDSRNSGNAGGHTNIQPGNSKNSKHKRQCTSLSSHNFVEKISTQLQHPILSLYFPGTQLQTLRGWLSGQLLDNPVRLRELNLAPPSSLLDKTLIGINSTEEQQTQPDILRCEIAAACRVLEDRSKHSHSAVEQDDVVNLVLQILFRRAQRSSSNKGRPSNILCLGYRTGLGDSQLGRWGVPIISSHPNSNVNNLKTSAWRRLLGIVGEDVMVRLLLEGSLFMPIDVGENGKGNGSYWQVSGE